MKIQDLDQPHRRFNILTGDWVLVSPQRTQRPWQGRVEDAPQVFRPDYDRSCYLCPSNLRADGSRNPDYLTTFAFDNDFPALRPGPDELEFNSNGLLLARAESGICRVICFSPRHDLTLAELPQEQIRHVVDLWTDEYRSLADRDDIGYVQIFENKGELMGCSNPHPHGQIWAQATVPDLPARELVWMKQHHERHGRPLLLDYLEHELDPGACNGERVVCSNRSFAAMVPFWAVWPFEVLVLPRRQADCLTELTAEEKTDLADMLRRVTVRYDNLFGTSFPYSAGIHQAPTNGKRHPECTLHLHFFPPLLRSATIKKFMVGYEMLAGPQRDITPEISARMLREQSDVHYGKLNQ